MTENELILDVCNRLANDPALITAADRAILIDYYSEQAIEKLLELRYKITLEIKLISVRGEKSPGDRDRLTILYSVIFASIVKVNKRNSKGKGK